MAESERAEGSAQMGSPIETTQSTNSPSELQSLVRRAKYMDDLHLFVQGVRDRLQWGWNPDQLADDDARIPEKYNIFFSDKPTAFETSERASNACRAIDGLDTKTLPALRMARQEIEDKIVFEARRAGRNEVLVGRALPEYAQMPEMPKKHNQRSESHPVQLRVVNAVDEPEVIPPIYRINDLLSEFPFLANNDINAAKQFYTFTIPEIAFLRDLLRASTKQSVLSDGEAQQLFFDAKKPRTAVFTAALKSYHVLMGLGRELRTITDEDRALTGYVVT